MKFARVAGGVIVLFGIGAPTLAATVLPGNGAQRTFLWHSNSCNEEKLALTPSYETFENSPPFRLGSRPNFDPNLPEGPSNRPFYTIYVPGPNSSVLERIFASMGADAEPGTNPDTGVNDDPAAYAYAGALADRANPFRGITPPTRNGLVNVPASGQMNRIPMSRTTNFPLGPAGDVYPTASPTGDTPDPRILSFFLDPTQGYNPGGGPSFLFPDVQVNIAGARIDGTGFGGDFSGVVPYFPPDFNPGSNAQRQIDGTLVPAQMGAFPLSNVAATGGVSELPLRPAPERGNLDASPNPDGAAQGVDFPFPLAAAGYERNVDPETGRPRIAGATGSCRTAGAYYLSATAIVSYADPVFPFPFPMQGGLGIGVDPDCLKAGGSAGGIHENRWDPADYAPLIAHYADSANNPLPVLYDLPGSSPQNALENHPANQGLFSWVCLATLGFLPGIAPEACLVSMFGSGQPLSPVVPLLSLSDLVGTLFAGEHSTAAQGFFTALVAGTKGAGAILHYTPVRNLNDDFKDGIITALNPTINPPGTLNDFLTLDQVLTNEQRALLGCGPFFGTRCDSGRGGIAINPSPPFQSINYQGLGYPAGGGIDLLNTEASAFLHAWLGTFGTDAGWTTTNRELGPQPGTIGFAGGPVCTREVNGETLVLPGCRGVQSLAFDSGANVWRAVFDNGYDVAMDGCVLGTAPNPPPGVAVSLNGMPIVATHDDGTPVDLVSCGTLGPNTTTTNSRTRQAPLPGQDGYGDALVHVPPFGPNFTTFVFGARTLFHPLAGCLSAAEVNDPNVLMRTCIFQTRNFDLEFANGTAQIFRSEIAAASWNLLQFLIVSSCDLRDDDLANDPECFLPQDPWRTDKCSLAAPQHCRNVKFLLALADEEVCNEAPDCSAAAASVDSLWPPNHKFAEIAITGVTDGDGDPISITIDSIFQDEPVNTVGDGNTAPDGAGVGTDAASVRAERSGTRKLPGDGRVYHIEFTAEDGQAGACEGSVTVCVPHDRGNGGACVDGGALFDSTSVGE